MILSSSPTANVLEKWWDEITIRLEFQTLIFIEDCVPYSKVAFLSVSKTELGGSNSWQGISPVANFIVRMLERVPSSWRLGHNFVLFLLTRLKTSSSAAFECGRVRTRIATCASFWKHDEP